MTTVPEVRSQSHRILEATARSFGEALADLTGESRTGRVVEARHAAMWVMRKAGYSLIEIGRVLDRDHTTVGYGVRRAQEIAAQDAEYHRLVLQVEAAVERSQPMSDEQAGRQDDRLEALLLHVRREITAMQTADHNRVRLVDQHEETIRRLRNEVHRLEQQVKQLQREKAALGAATDLAMRQRNEALTRVQTLSDMINTVQRRHDGT